MEHDTAGSFSLTQNVGFMLTKKGWQIATEIATEMATVAPVALNAKLKKFTKAEFEELGRLLRKFMGM